MFTVSANWASKFSQMSSSSSSIGCISSNSFKSENQVLTVAWVFLNNSSVGSEWKYPWLCWIPGKEIAMTFCCERFLVPKYLNPFNSRNLKPLVSVRNVCERFARGRVPTQTPTQKWKKGFSIFSSKKTRVLYVFK